MTFSKNQLKQAVKHVAFDVQHFLCYTRLHREGQLRRCTPTVSQAIIYSLLLHLRLLLDFFYGPPKHDDCWVGHFRILPGFTATFPSKILVPAPKDARALSVNLHKRLAHLTATRWEKKAPAMNYYDTYLGGIENLIATFQAALPSDVREVFTNAVGEWDRKHPAMFDSRVRRLNGSPDAALHVSEGVLSASRRSSGRSDTVTSASIGIATKLWENDFMPSSGDKPDEVFVKLFVSAYENFAWKDSQISWLDKHVDGAVEALVTRPDGETMAIEHTLIEPFVGNKHDFAAFEQSLEALRSDQALAVQNAGIEVYIPAGTMDGQKPAKRRKIMESVRSWIAENRLQLREGQHRYECQVPGEPRITLTVKFKPWRNANSPPGILVVGRQQIVNDLDTVVEKALRRKLPKLVNTRAARHILLLEREDFTFDPELIFAEIERQRPSFPSLNRVDEIWEVETVGYKSIGYVGFDMALGSNGPATMCFQNGVLTGHSGKDGIPYPM